MHRLIWRLSLASAAITAAGLAGCGHTPAYDDIEAHEALDGSHDAEVGVLDEEFIDAGAGFGAGNVGAADVENEEFGLDDEETEITPWVD